MNEVGIELYIQKEQLGSGVKVSLLSCVTQRSSHLLSTLVDVSRPYFREPDSPRRVHNYFSSRTRASLTII